MPSNVYRVYIRFGENKYVLPKLGPVAIPKYPFSDYYQPSCVRFFAPGVGMVAKDGLQLFEWMRDPSNIVKLRNGLQHMYEMSKMELPHFLEFKLREDRTYMRTQMNRYQGGADMLAAFKQKHEQFDSLQTGVKKLEVIANTSETTAIPRASPRKRSGETWVRQNSKKIR